MTIEHVIGKIFIGCCPDWKSWKVGENGVVADRIFLYLAAIMGNGIFHVATRSYIDYLGSLSVNWPYVPEPIDRME